MGSSPVPIVRFFFFVRLARGNNADNRIVRAEAVTYDQDSQSATDAEHKETFLVCRMVWIEEPHGILIEEDRLRFLKRHAVFASVLLVLALVPFESYVSHIYTVCISLRVGKSFFAAGTILQKTIMSVNFAPLIRRFRAAISGLVQG